MNKISNPRDLLVEELKDLYSAENQLLKALPKMAEAATSDELREAFEDHLGQTQGHVERLDKIGTKLGQSMAGKKCKAMAGLVAEGAEIMEEDAEPAMMDLALIGAAQKVEHYEIAGYGTTRTLAELAGEDEIAGILQETLDEEGETDKLLTKIATGMDLGLEDDEQAVEKPVGKSTIVMSPEADDEEPVEAPAGKFKTGSSANADDETDSSLDPVSTSMDGEGGKAKKRSGR